MKEVSGQGTQERQSPQQRNSAKNKQSQQSSAKPQKRRKPDSKIAKRHIGNEEKLGSGVREHLASHMEAGHVSAHVSEHLSRDVEKSVSEHLGNFSAEERSDTFAPTPTESRNRAASASSIVNLLRSPEGLRQAILLNEILSPPKSLRHKK